MVGKLISIENGPERNVEIVVRRDEVKGFVSKLAGIVPGIALVAFHEKSHPRCPAWRWS